MTDTTSTVFLANGSVFTPMSKADLNLHQQLPAGNFTVIKHPMTGALMLQRIDSFATPPKLYGSINKRADRILSTFQDRPNATGALFAGEKGSGKTQLARLLSIKAAAMNMPTLLITEPHVGEDFFKLVHSIQQPMVVLFDEFEKVYDHDDQKRVLTLLDGMFPSKKLFVLTSNDKWLINEHMRNRPGRIFYLIDFRGLEEDFIREYCEDVLQAKDQIERIVRVSKLFNEFNFDMLKALVEEMNRYGDTPEQALEMLNARPSSDQAGSYRIAVMIDGRVIDPGRYYPNTIEGSPMSESEMSVTITECESPSDSSSDDPTDIRASLRRHRSTAAVRARSDGRMTITIRQQNLQRFDHTNGMFEYVVPDAGARITFQRERTAEADYFSLL